MNWNHKPRKTNGEFYQSAIDRPIVFSEYGSNFQAIYFFYLYLLSLPTIEFNLCCKFFQFFFLVLVAINANGLYVIDPLNVVILLGLKLEELSWDYAKPSQENNEDCLPCLFIQFCVIENGRRVSKILQIFSRQASQMDALINTFVDELKQRVAMYNEDHEFGDSSLPDADGK